MTYESYLWPVVEAALEAGDAILDVYHSDFAVEQKADNSPLTLADRRSHEIILRRLRTFGIPVLSEEGRDISYQERKGWERLWIVDPLDGTKEFVKRLGEFTVNIALVQRGRPVLGVVLAPERKMLYFGAEELGAHKIEDLEGLKRLRGPAEVKNGVLPARELVEAAVRLPRAQPGGAPFTIVGSRSHPGPDLETFVQEKRRRYGEVTFVSSGSSVKFCLVAEGKAQVYPRLGPTMEWDTAAGQVVAECSGATVLRHDTGEPLTYNKEDLRNPWFIVERPGS